MSELKNSITHYENDISVLKDRIIEFEGLKNDILIKKTQQIIKKRKLIELDVMFFKYGIHRAT